MWDRNIERHSFNSYQNQLDLYRALVAKYGAQDVLDIGCAQGTLAVLPFKGRSFTRPLAILHRKGRVLTPAMKKFVEILGLELPETKNA